MSSANASSIQVRHVREVTQGVLPAGAMRIIPFETWKIGGPVSREQPGNVSADSTVADNPAMDIKVTGTGKSDFLYADYDDLIGELFCADLSTPFSLTATTISAAATGNKLVGPAASWVGLRDGDDVLVTGFATNGAVFVARVSGAPGSTDLVLDANFKTLVNEAAGPSVTVYHSGIWRLGTGMLTGHWEEWNTGSGVGKESGGIGVSQLQVDVPQPNKCVLNWTFVGLTNKVLAAQLANASTQPSGNPAINSNINFGDKSTIGSGMGFRYGNSGGVVSSLPTLMPNLRIKKWMLTIARPLLAEGGAGTLGPIDLSVDKRFDIKLAMTFLRNTPQAETILADADDSTSVCQIGIGFRDASGHRQYFWLPAMQPSNENTSGLAQTGRETGSVEYVAKKSSEPAGMIQWCKFS